MLGVVRRPLGSTACKGVSGSTLGSCRHETFPTCDTATCTCATDGGVESDGSEAISTDEGVLTLQNTKFCSLLIFLHLCWG